MRKTSFKNTIAANKIKASIAGLAILSASTVGTMALLSDSATTDVVITSATFGMTVNGNDSSGDYEVILNSKNLAPGETRTGDIKITNDSTIPATITMTKSPLTGFTSTVKNLANQDFTTVTLPAKGSTDLKLTIGVPASATTSPADETLSITFNAVQGSYN